MTKSIFELLFSAVVNFPILKQIGRELRKLPVIVVEPQEFAITTRYLLKNGITISEDTSNIDFFDILSSASAGFLIYQYIPSKDSIVFINRLARMVKTGIAGTKDLRSLPLVICDTVPLVDDRASIFIIHITGAIPFDQADLSLCIPQDDVIPSLLEEIQAHDRESGCPELDTLKTAAYFFLPQLRARGQEDRFSSYLNLADSLVKEDDADDTLDGIIEIFAQALECWGKTPTSPKIWRLPDLPMDATEYLKESIFFNEDSFFMKEDLFREVVIPVLPSIPISTIKRGLWREKALISTDSKTFSVKMGYRTSIGAWERTRMLRFSRERMMQPGKLDFVSNCLTKMEEKHL